MLDEWVKLSLQGAKAPANFYSGSRKIIRPMQVTFKKIRDDLNIRDCGYGKAKITLLKKAYFHQESHAVAVEMWKNRVEKDRYGSVCFHTYNHYVKGTADNAYWNRIQSKKAGSPRGSVMGPCIQAVSLTLLGKGKVSVDCFYRTTELFKKFAADLIFIRDVLLPDFNLDWKHTTITFHFANVTCHPMYFLTVLPSLDDPIGEMDKIKKADRYFYEWCVKWSARYICNEYMRGIQNFAQAMRVRTQALEYIEPKLLKQLQKYMRANHPGYRNAEFVSKAKKKLVEVGDEDDDS